MSLALHLNLQDFGFKTRSCRAGQSSELDLGQNISKLNLEQSVQHVHHFFPTNMEPNCGYWTFHKQFYFLWSKFHWVQWDVLHKKHACNFSISVPKIHVKYRATFLCLGVYLPLLGSKSPWIVSRFEWSGMRLGYDNLIIILELGSKYILWKAKVRSI